MTETQLEAFRSLATAMNPEPHDWQWIGPHMSQRMFGITEQRAREYAARHGGTARKLEPTAYPVTRKPWSN
jgi:hypothetical protein